VADENGKSDLKKRLGRRRLRTASKKGLETQGTPESQDNSMPMDAPMAPSGEMPAVTGPVGGDPGISAEYMPVGDGSGAPAPAMPEIDISKFAKGSTKMIYIVSIFVGLAGFGMGHCFGHRVEQNKYANMARKDANDILTDITSVDKEFAKIRAKFTSKPTKLTGWGSEFDHIALAPNLALAGKAKLTWIPTPGKRKSFLKNLITYYATMIMVNQQYANYKNYVSVMYEPNKALFEAIEKEPGKDAKAKVASYTKKLGKSIKDKMTGKKEQKFVILMMGGSQRSIIVPLSPRNMVCPKNPIHCACDPAAKKPKKGQPCVRKCKDKCDGYQKIYKLKGSKKDFGPFANQEFTFSTSGNKDLMFSKAQVAIKFDAIAPKTIGLMLKHQIFTPYLMFMRHVGSGFNQLKKLIKSIKGPKEGLKKALRDASSRKKRGLF
jgi:ribosomal protein S17E